MQTPAGYELKDGIAFPTDWLAVIFNPSFPYRFAHMLNAAYLTTGFVVPSGRARYHHRRTPSPTRRASALRMAIGCDCRARAVAVTHHDQHGLNTLRYQPVSVAGRAWRRIDGSKPGDFHIFAWPDEQAGVNRFAISIPRGASLILTHDPKRVAPGLPALLERTAEVQSGFFSPSRDLRGGGGRLHDRSRALRRKAMARTKPPTAR